MSATLRERLIAWRDDLLSRPAIQTLTVSIPGLRGVANKRARALFDLCIGFVHTQVVTACVELDMFDILAGQRRSVAFVAEATHLSEEAATKLLDAGVAIGLFVRDRDGLYRLGELGAALRGASGVRDLVRHNQIFYRDLADPVGLLRGERKDLELAQYWPYAPGDADVAELPEAATAPYSRLMAATQPFIADDVIAAYPFARHRRLLDVGGGDGAFAAAVAEANSHLHVSVFDLPSVSALASARFAQADLGARSCVHAGDFHRDRLPDGYDIISLVRICLDHDDAAVVNLLRSIHRALAPGGRVLVAELMSGAAGAETIADAYFAFYLMAMGRGRPRSAAALTRLLAQAGFTQVKPVSTRRALMTQLLVAVR